MDVDSTLIQGEVIEMLAAHAGCADEVAAITEAAMRGELDFEGVAARAGRSCSPASTRASWTTYVAASSARPGARTLVRTLKRLDYKFAIVSGGFTQITDAARRRPRHRLLRREHPRDRRRHASPDALIGPIIDRAGKAAALARFAAEAGVPLARPSRSATARTTSTCSPRAGLGIAFNAKPVVREAADTALNVPYLDSISVPARHLPRRDRGRRRRRRGVRRPLTR